MFDLNRLLQGLCSYFRGNQRPENLGDNEKFLAMFGPTMTVIFCVYMSVQNCTNEQASLLWAVWALGTLYVVQSRLNNRVIGHLILCLCYEISLSRITLVNLYRSKILFANRERAQAFHLINQEQRCNERYVRLLREWITENEHY